MRKLLLLVLLAGFSCPYSNAQDGGTAESKISKNYKIHIDSYPWNYVFSASGSIYVTFDQQWGEFQLTGGGAVDLSAYKGCKIVYAGASDVSLYVKYANDAEDSHAKSENLSGSDTFEYTFETSYGNVTTFELQGTEEGASVNISEAYLIKTDGTEDTMVYGGVSWGCSYVVNEYPATISYTGQYGGPYIVDADTNLPASYTYGSGGEQVYTISFSQATTCDLYVELDYEYEDTYEDEETHETVTETKTAEAVGFSVSSDVTTYTFTVNDDVCGGHNVDYIYIKANSSNDAGDDGYSGYTSYANPYAISFSGITAEITVGDEDDGDSSDEDYIITKTTTTGEGEDAVTTYNYYMNLGVSTEIWEMSDGEEGTLTGDDAGTITPVYKEDTDANTSATLVFKGTNYGGMGWLYPNGVDMSTSYYQVVMTYEVTAASGGETAKVLLDLYDADGNSAQASDDSEDGTITLVFNTFNKNAEADKQVDFSQIVQIMVQASVPCTVNVTSIELMTESSGVVYDQYLLLSQFDVWENDAGNSYEYNSDTGYYDMTLNASWTGGQWYFGDIDEDSYWGVVVRIKTDATCKIRLSVVYAEDGYSENYSVDGNGEDDTVQVLFLPFNKDYDSDVVKISIMCGDLGDAESCVISLVSAELISPDDPNDTDVNSEIRRITTNTTEGYATYCCDKDFQIPEFLTGYIITYVANEKSDYSTPDDTDATVEDGGTAKAGVRRTASETEEGEDPDEGYAVTIVQKYVYPDIVPAKTPILVKGCGDTERLTYTAYVDEDGAETPKYVADDDAVKKAEGNMLQGNSSKDELGADDMASQTVTAYNEANGASLTSEDFYFYELDYGRAVITTDDYGNTSTTYYDLGFYWYYDEGAAFPVPGNRAWLPIPQSYFSDSGVTGLKMIEYVEEDSGDGTTGIETVSAETAASSRDGIYTLQGVRVSNMNKPGVYIVDGKKVIRK